MLDIAWPELIVIGIVAVVAIGPKDLPKVMNTMGRFAGKARLMAQDVQRSRRPRAKRVDPAAGTYRRTRQASCANAKCGHAAGAQSRAA
jgi:sec-independent protein translocase protein TatB